MERIAVQTDGITNAKNAMLTTANLGIESRAKQKIIIVGAGPAGLFCALSLASSGLFTPIILERGKPVEARGKSIGALVHRRALDPESNFSFGEGGAGNVDSEILPDTSVCLFLTLDFPLKERGVMASLQPASDVTVVQLGTSMSFNKAFWP
jgi:uncharacterized FAD-dependent dehydrogenase